jgi:hypothetical protein
MPKKTSSSLRRQTMYLVGFILAVSVALISYIQSNFLEDYININLVSLFFVISNALTIVSIAVKLLYW